MLNTLSPVGSPPVISVTAGLVVTGGAFAGGSGVGVGVVCCIVVFGVVCGASGAFKHPNNSTANASTANIDSIFFISLCYSNSFGIFKRAFSSVIRPACNKSVRDFFIVCMPSFVEVSMTELI